MKAVVATEVERFVFRPGLKDRAQYYAVIFLNQMVLSHKDSEGVLLVKQHSTQRKNLPCFTTL